MATDVVLIVFAVMFGAWASAVYFATKATLNRKPGVPYFPGNLQSPLNILFRPHQLTDAGKRARRNCFISVAVLLLGMFTLMAIGIWQKFTN